jgi:hypothetical protein
MNLKRHVHWLVYGLFFLGCARQTSPTGGPKDTIPPTLIQSNPKDGQTNFRSQELQLAFDETVILNNPKDQIIITPDIRKEYDVNVKKNKVVLKLKTELQDSTTYAINFREAVQGHHREKFTLSTEVSIQHRHIHRFSVLLRDCIRSLNLKTSKRHYRLPSSNKIHSTFSNISRYTLVSPMRKGFTQ